MPGREPARYDLVVATHLLPIADTPDRSVAWYHRADGIFGVIPDVAEGTVAFVGAPSGRPVYRPTSVGAAWLHPAHLPEAMRHDFLAGHCAQTLAPTFHGIGRPAFRRAWAEAYQQANDLFAHRIAGLAAPGGTVWLHDYHLLAAPTLLRRLRPDLRIGVQLHSPFPPPELLMRLPDRDQLIQGLSHADLIAVAHPRSIDNLRATMADVADRVPAQVIPLGIDAAGVSKLARDPAVRDAAAELRAALGNRTTMLLSMGRLDAAQGILHRLDAFDALLATGRLDPARTVLAQILTAADHTDDTTALRRQVEQAVARINGRHGTVGRPVVHYQYRSLDMRETVTLYLAADVLLATPLAGGTDLTAKEYLAARTDHTGRLVLSELSSSSSSELAEAYRINPHDIASTTSTIATATSQAHTACPAMAAMRERVTSHDAAHQTRRFLQALGHRPSEPSTPPLVNDGVGDDLVPA